LKYRKFVQFDGNQTVEISYKKLEKNWNYLEKSRKNLKELECG